METTPEQQRSALDENRSTKSYWSRNLTRLAILLSIWFLGSYGASILFVDSLDQVEFFGFPLGFWFAQQGSILVFLVLIVIYVRTMNALDDEYVSNDSSERVEQDGRGSRKEGEA